MKRYLTVGIISGVLLIVVVAISWLVFPAWKDPTTGGFWALLGIAALGVVTFIKAAVSIWKDLKEDKKAPPLAPTQSVGSQQADNIYNVFGGTVNTHQQTEESTEDTPEIPANWHLKHRYALTANFTGREAEREKFTEWLEGEKEQPLLILRALGGFGKSVLAWYWLLHDVDKSKWTHAVWWSFYEGDSSSDNFLSDTLKYLLGENVQIPSTPRLQVEILLKELEKPGILLILDGFERALRAYSNMNAAYQEDDETEKDDIRDRDCVSPVADDFLRGVASSAGLIQAKILMTTRLTPRAVVRHGEHLQGCCEEELKAMDKKDAVAFFRGRGVQGTRAEIESACDPYGYHPLTLSILAGLIVDDRKTPGDIAVAKQLDITDDVVQNKHHVLEVAYDTLSPEQQKLLSHIACFRTAMAYDALQAISDREIDADLEVLENRSLLHWDKTANKYDLHPIVRRYAYDRLTAPDRTAAHTRLRDYFAAVPEPEKIETLDDLAPVIELYHHMVRAGQYDEACDLLYDRLVPNPLHFQFGAYRLMIELKHALFPDGEDQPPRLEKESDQAWILNALANSYSMSGEPRRAVMLFEMHNDLQEKWGDKDNLAIGLWNVADDQLKIGALGDAERNLRRGIDLCREIEDEGKEGIGHYELGRVLAYTGQWDESEKALKVGEIIKKKTNHIQGQGIIWSYRALRSLLLARDDPAQAIEHWKQATESATHSLELTDETARTSYPHERDYVRSYWLLGAAYRVQGDLSAAERHLVEALRRCRANNTVEAEAEILLEVAKLRHALGESEEALRLVQEALVITERSGYVLQGADVHLFLAELAPSPGPSPKLGEGSPSAAMDGVREHAEAALQLAHCDDGPPYHYKVAYEEAQRLLEKLKSN